MQSFKIPVSWVEKEDLRFDIPVTHPISLMYASEQNKLTDTCRVEEIGIEKGREEK